MSEDALSPGPVLPVQTSNLLPDAGSSAAPAALAPASAPTIPKGEESLRDRREFLWRIHGYTNEYIRFADTKAGFCAGIAAALIGTLFASKSHQLFIANQWTDLAPVSLAAFALLGASTLISIWVISPRLWSHTQAGVIFWGDIAKFENASSFTAGYSARSDRELDTILSEHLYSLAKVCRRKYLFLGLSIVTATLGGILAATVLLLKG